MLVVFFLGLIMAFLLFEFFQQPKFGGFASGESLKRIKSSPNFRNGQFQNISHTPNLTEGVRFLTVLKEFFFEKSRRSKPETALPSQKTNLFELDPHENILVWFGHSSYFLQIDGKKILVDPVLSGSASPIKFTTRSFEGSDVYSPDDIPAIDYLFISHDHWDHLDYETLIALKKKIGKIITGLGVGAHLERWGFEKERILESDWNEEIVLAPGFVVNTVPARHFSGRGLKRNRSLWLSFALKTPGMNVFIGGDSGYDGHFAKAGEALGPFDLAILECGQYNKNWKYIHMMPGEVVRAATELRARKILPVHWSKFSLALHDWDEPIRRLVEKSKHENFVLIHPMIGEKITLKSIGIQRSWWEISGS